MTIKRFHMSVRSVDTGDTTWRNALLRKCMDLGLSLDSIEQITKQMKDKSNEEKEWIAKLELAKMSEPV